MFIIQPKLNQKSLKIANSKKYTSEIYIKAIENLKNYKEEHFQDNEEI